MKRFIALALALVCLCPLLSAAAQTSLPFPLFRKNFNAAYESLVGGSTVIWHTTEADGRRICIPLADDLTILAMVILDGNDVAQIIVQHNGGTDDDAIMAFVVTTAFTGTALTLTAASTPEETFDRCLAESYEAMTAYLQGSTGFFNMWGMPCRIDVLPADNGAYDYTLTLFPSGIPQ